MTGIRIRRKPASVYGIPARSPCSLRRCSTWGSSSITNNNTAFSDGGGIYNDNGGTVTLNDSSSITNNTAFGGGGIFNDGGTVTLWSPLLAVFDNNPDDCFNC